MPKLTVELPGGMYHTIAGVQKKTGRCRNTIRKLIATGQLDAREFIGLTIISDASLQNYFDNLPMANLARKAVVNAVA
jgi:hypothetical protein